MKYRKLNRNRNNSKIIMTPSLFLLITKILLRCLEKNGKPSKRNTWKCFCFFIIKLSFQEASKCKSHIIIDRKQMQESKIIFVYQRKSFYYRCAKKIFVSRCQTYQAFSNCIHLIESWGQRNVFPLVNSAHHCKIDACVGEFF